jgi:hypothetical protein
VLKKTIYLLIITFLFGQNIVNSQEYPGEYRILTPEGAIESLNYNIELPPGKGFQGYLYFWSNGGSLTANYLPSDPFVFFVSMSPTIFTSTSCSSIVPVSFVFSTPNVPGTYTKSYFDQNNVFPPVNINLIVTNTPTALTPDTVILNIGETEFITETISASGFTGIGCLPFYLPSNSAFVSYSTSTNAGWINFNPSIVTLTTSNPSAVVEKIIQWDTSGYYSTYEMRTFQWLSHPRFTHWKFKNMPVITKPSNNYKYIVGETDSIKWLGGKAGQVFQIDYSVDDGASYTPIDVVPADLGYLVWNIPANTLTTKAKIRISDFAVPAIEVSSEKFRVKPYILTRIDENGDYYEYRKNRDQWGFSNTPNDMWPQNWWQQFNYQGIDPFTGSQYSQWQCDFAFATSVSAEHMDWISWVNSFGIDVCYWSTATGIYKSKAVLHWKSKQNVWNGSCFGIAIANALLFGYRDSFLARYPDFPDSTKPINIFSNNTVKAISNELFTHQWGNPTQANDKVTHNIITPNQVVDQLKQILKDDIVFTRTLSIYNNGGSGGHTILPYGLQRDTVQIQNYDILVYDNSNPNSNNPITVNTVTGTWNSADWPGWGGNTGLYLELEADTYLNGAFFTTESNSLSPFMFRSDVLEISYSSPGEIQIVDGSGNITGFSNNSVIREIPGSIPMIIRNGSETPPIGYSLQIDDYSVVLSDFEEESVETFFFNGNKSFVYERSGATQTQTDRLFFDGGLSVTNPDAQTKTVKLMNLLDESTQEKFTVVRGIELVQNDSVKIENPDSNKIKLISYGSAKNYDIELNYVTENGIGRFGDFSIPLTANTSHTFIPDWTNLTNSQLLVLVDIGNNGIIDDTLSLVNQVTGIDNDQGSLVSPDSYNLEQNYPNPFNPSTKISWQSPVSSHQTLKVYDVLGNEVATLVDEFREAGRFEVTFDGSNLASGMYLYRLQAGSFIETRKMILIK